MPPESLIPKIGTLSTSGMAHAGIELMSHVVYIFPDLNKSRCDEPARRDIALTPTQHLRYRGTETISNGRKTR